MTVRSLGWLGVRTHNAEAMIRFYDDVLQLEVVRSGFLDKLPSP